MGTDLVHDEDLWFPDGTVVLKAEHTLFRVYGGILSRASPIFKDMFSIGQSQSDKKHVETYEGCPLVVMAGDSAIDMRQFLWILHHSSHVLQQTPTLDEILQIISVLRLGTKYEVVHLRRWAIETLQKWFPPTLSRFQSAYLDNDLEDIACSVAVANVARETSAWILLPSSLLWCATQARSSRELYDGITQPSGSRLELLPENRRMIFTRRPLLEHACRERTLAFIFHPHSQSTGCTFPMGPCEGFRKTVYDIFARDPDQSFDPFSPILLPLMEPITRGCCETCISRWAEQNQRAVEELWEELPSIFDLQPWDQLQSSVDNNSETSSTATTLTSTKGLYP